MEDIFGEPHHLSGSLKEDRKNLREAMKNFVDINALVARCCWQASSGDMEGESFLEECIALKEGMAKMKERYMNLLSDREYLLMVAELYHSALKKEEEKSENMTNKLEITSNLLKRTQISLQESKLQIFQTQKDFKVSPLSCCMEGNVLGIMEEYNLEDEHAKISKLQVLVKVDTIEYIDQKLVSLQKYIQEDITFRFASNYTYLSKDWISEYIVEIETQGCTSLACKCK